jgi:hypothetical protein
MPSPMPKITYIGREKSTALKAKKKTAKIVNSKKPKQHIAGRTLTRKLTCINHGIEAVRELTEDALKQDEAAPCVDCNADGRHDLPDRSSSSPFHIGSFK